MMGIENDTHLLFGEAPRLSRVSETMPIFFVGGVGDGVDWIG